MSQIFSSCQTRMARSTGFRNLLGRLLSGLTRVRQARRAVRDMALLDDHMLADIGLDRASIGFAARYGRVPRQQVTVARRRESERALYDQRFFRLL